LNQWHPPLSTTLDFWNIEYKGGALWVHSPVYPVVRVAIYIRSITLMKPWLSKTPQLFILEFEGSVPLKLQHTHNSTLFSLRRPGVNFSNVSTMDGLNPIRGLRRRELVIELAKKRR
jgi:hypothetical protein